MPVKAYPHGKEQYEDSIRTASHRVKIGTTIPREGKRPIPTWVNGFFIVKNTRMLKKDGGGFVLDEDLMLRLDPKFTKANVEKALKENKNAPIGALPQEIEFELIGDAVRTADGTDWLFPGMFDSEYAAFGVSGAKDPSGKGKLPIEDPMWAKERLTTCPGLFCRGDGETATRKNPDGTRRRVPCNPTGKTGVEAKDFCPIHKRGACKMGVDFVCLLGIRKPSKPGEPLNPLEPLARQHHARFIVETTSPDNEMAIRRELRIAANALQGRLSGVQGTMRFFLAKKVTPNTKGSGGDDEGDGEGGTGVCGQITINLNTYQIREMAQALGIRPVFASPHHAGELPGPVATEDVIDVEVVSSKPMEAPRTAAAPAEEKKAEPAPPAPPKRHEDIAEAILFSALTEYVGGQAGEHDVSFEDAWQDCAWIHGREGVQVHAKLEGTPRAFAPDVADPAKRLRFLRTICDRLCLLDEDGWLAILEQVREPSFAPAAGTGDQAAADQKGTATEPAGATVAASKPEEKKADDTPDDGFYATDQK